MEIQKSDFSNVYSIEAAKCSWVFTWNRSTSLLYRRMHLFANNLWLNAVTAIALIKAIIEVLTNTVALNQL
ncbi:hypothetical protein [uncultured Nostoc sp.]|uniref:hypothetical protein n=1 Tax=uncultured Nostoc sp. TaxID=340711 RepID=UPI0035CC8258